MISRRLIAGLVGVALALPATMVTAGPLEAGAAAVFTVDTTADAVDASPGNGVCATQAGTCSLRAAVAEANATTGATIQLPAGRFALSIDRGSDSGDLDLTAPMTIRGAAEPPGPGASTIDAAGIDRVLDIAAAVTVEGVVLTGGNASRSSGGGAVVNSGATLDLVDSTVDANSARDGGGVAVASGGTATISRSTISANTAQRKGGGILVDGGLELAASTVVDNTAQGGGGVSSAGSARLLATTVMGNDSTNSNGGGVLRNGGDLFIRSSILASNNGADGRDCYGSPTFEGANLLQLTPGCNPSGDPLLVTDPMVAPLADNGGATLTRLPEEGSPAIDVIEEPCATPTDQRGVARDPEAPGGRCDLGAVEIAPLSVDLDLSAEGPGSGPSCPDATVCVGAGASEVPVADIPGGAIVATSEATGDTPEDTLLRRTLLRRTLLRRTLLRRTLLRRTDLEASAISAITIEDLLLRRTLLRRTDAGDVNPLDQIPLSDLPLYVEGQTWESLLAGTEFADLPLQYVTLGDVIDLPQVSSLGFADVGLASTSFGSLSGTAVALAPLSLDEIPLGEGGELDGWCDYLDGTLEGGCDALGIDPSDPSSADGVGLVTLALSGTDLEQAPLEDILLRRTLLRRTYIADILLRRTLLRRTDLEGTEIGAVLLRRTGALEGLVDCSLIDCDDDSLTLSDALLAGAIRDDATVASLLDYLEQQPEWDELRLFDLMAVILQAFFPADGLSFDQIDLKATSLQPIADPTEPPFTLVGDVTVDGAGGADVTLTVELPDGFEPVPGTVTVDGNAVDDPARDGQTLRIDAGRLGSGVHSIRLDVWAGLELGPVNIEATADAVAGEDAASDTDTTDILVVVESFEPGNEPGDSRTIDGGVLTIAHLSSAYDRDWYSFYVSPDDAAAGVSARLYLANLVDMDADMLLYGPAVAPLRSGTAAGPTSVVDDGIGLLPASESVAPDVGGDVAPTPPADCGVAGTPAACTTYGRAAQRGATDDLIETGRLPAGTYHVEVRGYNGDFSDQPYTLRRRLVTGEPLGECTPRASAPAPTGPVVTLPAGLPAADVEGYILVPEGRFLRDDGAADTATLMATLTALATETRTALVRVDADAAVRGAFDAWDDEPCSTDASNEVVRRIGQVLDVLDVASPAATSLTMVGSHVQLPMGLVADNTSLANESTYDPGTDLGTDNALSAALQAGYMLTDDAYATDTAILADSQQVYLPTKTIGRIGETAADATDAAQRFLDHDGVLDPTTATSAFVSDYDFLTDGGAAVADALTGQGATVDRLTGEEWTRQDLADGLLDGDNDLSLVAGHADHNRFLPAIGNLTNDETDLFTVGDVIGSGALDRDMVASIGCHSALPVPDVELGFTDPTDWVEAYNGEGAVYAGNTTYGYGDSELVAYSERLAELFFTNLGGERSVGEALQLAKQQYYAELQVLGPYHAKVLMAFTLFGLPFYEIGGGLEPGAAPAAAAAAAPEATPLAPAGPTGPSTVALPPIDLTIADPGTPSAPGLLTPNERGGGTVFDHDGDFIETENRPVVPQVRLPVGQGGQRATGVAITGLSTEELADFSPYYSAAVPDKSSEAPLDPIGDAIFPSTLAEAANIESPDGSISSVANIAAGRFEPGDEAGVGTMQLFTRIQAEVNFADPDAPQTAGPAIVRTDAAIVGQTVGFTMRTDDTATRAFVLFKSTDPTVSQWTGIDLVNTGTDPVDGSKIWTGGYVLPSPEARIQYFGWARNLSGAVTYTTNKASDFEAVPQEECGIGVTIEPAGSLTPSGWYNAPDGLTVTFADELTEASLDGGPLTPVPAGGLRVTGEGVHSVAVRNSEGSCTLKLPIDTVAPGVTATVDPAPNGGGWNAGDVDLTIRAIDPGGSGVESIRYSVNGGAEVSVDGTVAVVPVTAGGTTTVTYRATDAAGNTSGEGTAVIRIDDIAPTVSATVNPAPQGGWNTGPVSVQITASDAQTSVASVDYSVGGAPAVIVAGNTASAPVSAQGTTVVSFGATDAAGNRATGSISVRIDSVAPTVTITSPAGNAVPLGAALTAAYSCSDSGSGIASCTATLTGPSGTVAVPNGGALPTATAGTYTLTVTGRDVAGNQTVRAATYTVAYRVCLLYDPTNAQPIGGTVPIRLQLCRADGTNLSSSSIKLMATFIDGTIQPPPNFQGKSNLGFEFRYDPKSKGYVYNLNTDALTAGPHVLSFTVNGTASALYVAPFTLKA